MIKKYCFSEIISNVYAFLLTKLFYSGARFIGRPLYLRNGKCMEFKPGLTLGHACRFDLDGNAKTLFIGANCNFGDNTHMVAYEKVEIGDNVLGASKIFISDTNHGCYKGENQDSPYVAPNDRKLVTSPVKIGNNVWIGENVVILAGVHIGSGCVIGANSVVTKDIEENCIAAGVPARVIKHYNANTHSWDRV